MRKYYRVIGFERFDAFYGDNEYIGKIVEFVSGPTLSRNSKAAYQGYMRIVSLDGEPVKNYAICVAAVNLEPITKEEMMRLKRDDYDLEG